MPTAPRLAAVALIAAACTGGSESSPLPRNPGIALHPVLSRFESCAGLEQAIEDRLVLQMRSTIEQLREGWYVGVPAVGGDAPSTAVPGAAEGPSAWTTTNAQVEGVAEADFVQNDGTRIAAVSGGQLHLVTSWPPKELERVASVPIEGWPHALFLAGDRAVVFSAVYVPRELEGPAPACLSMPGVAPCGYGGENVVKISTFDVSSLAAPALLSEIYLPGAYVSARRVGDRVRLVLRDDLPFPEGVSFWPDVPYGASDEQVDAAWTALEARNEALIRAATLEGWLRAVRVARPGLPDVEVGYACGEFADCSGPAAPGILTIATLDLAAPGLVDRTSVLADAGVVYASATTLYAASPHWWWWPEPGQRDATYLHAFDLRDPDRAVYAGSGVVDGIVRDQYALDEHDGALRAITTTRERVDDGTSWGRPETAGRLSVLRPEDGALALVGETPAFGAGETVFGTRFLGTRAFAITAQQIDPLFTFDLSDPAAPTIVGELEMPGFIAYLHPIDDTHLLGVGRQAPAVGAPTELKVALLDVADLAHPVDVSTVIVGEGWSWSEALWDPKAFTWFGARGLLAIPFEEWGPSTFTSDLRLFHVDAATGITPAGVLPMDDVYADGPAFAWYWLPWVRRSILADDFVYAVSDAGIRSASVAGLPAWLATAPFPPLAP